MIGATATATEMQNNFGRYIPRDTAVSYLTDSLTGILKGDTSITQAKEERLKEKYEIAE